MFRLSVAIALSLISITACGRNSTPTTRARAHRRRKHRRPPSQRACAVGSRAQTSESELATASQETTSDALPKSAATPGSNVSPRCLRISSCPRQVESRHELRAARSRAADERGAGQGRSGGGVLVRLRPAGNALEPFIQSWLKNKPEYVEFVRVPVMWGPVHRAHAQLFYMLRALKRTDLDSEGVRDDPRPGQHARVE